MEAGRALHETTQAGVQYECWCFRRYVWLADELRAELKYEKDELALDEHVEKESSILVFREFGASRRLSKPELKHLEKLVAKRTQCAREIWRTPLMKAVEELHKERDLNWDRDGYLRKINEKTVNFVRIQRARLKSEGTVLNKSLTGSGEIQENGNNERAEKKKGLEKMSGRMLMEVLEGHLNSLLELTARALLERDGLADEKTRALKILDLPGKAAYLTLQLPCKLDRMAPLVSQLVLHNFRESFCVFNPCMWKRTGFSKRKQISSGVEIWLDSISEIPNTKLDVKLREAMEAAENQLTETEQKLRSKEKTAVALEEQLNDLRKETNNEIQNKQRRIQELQQSLTVGLHSSLSQ